MREQLKPQPLKDDFPIYTQSELNAALALRTREAAEKLASECIKRYGSWGSSPGSMQDFVAAILSLIKPDESAALAERDRRVRLEEAELWHTHTFGIGNDSIDWKLERIAALRGTGEEKQP